MNNNEKSNSTSLALDADPQQSEPPLEQTTYDAMMEALEKRDWTNYYGLSAQWYALFKARRTLAKSDIDPDPASQPLREGFEIPK